MKHQGHGLAAVAVVESVLLPRFRKPLPQSFSVFLTDTTTARIAR